MTAEQGLTLGDRRACIAHVVRQPRQIYASTADRRHGRRWARRHRPYWIPAAAVLVLALAETLRNLA